MLYRKDVFRLVVMIPFLIGIGLTLVALAGSVLFGFHKEKVTFVVILITIPLFYVVFSIEHGDPKAILLNIAAAIGFTILALLGRTWSYWIVAMGLVAHGLFDIIYHWTGTSPAPTWWAPFCLAVDVLLGAFLAFLIWRKPPADINS